jgi:hypothetical protein
MSVPEKKQVGEREDLNAIGKYWERRKDTHPRTRSNLSDRGEDDARLCHNINPLHVGRRRRCDIRRTHKLDS